MPAPLAISMYAGLVAEWAPDVNLWMDASPSFAMTMLGGAVYVVLGGLMVLALVGLPLRGLGLIVGLTRQLSLYLARMWSKPTPSVEPQPLSLDGLSPGLSRLAQQTRTLALELRRRSEEARHWPEDGGEVERAGSWWSELVAGGVDFSPLMNTRREVFDWVNGVEQLGHADRQQLEQLGIDVERVRAALTETGPVAEAIRGLAGMVWAIDERLSGAASVGYRGGVGTMKSEGASGLGSPVSVNMAGVSPDEPEVDEPEVDELGQRRRFAAVMNDHRRGISRLANSYTKSTAEREDLEQDIALALWKALPSFRGESKLETFVYKVARYCCYRGIRQRGRLRSDNEALAHLDDPDACIETQLLRADERAQLERALAGLPDKLEAALSLHLGGLSYAEIAARLGISERNVSVRLTRARRRLQLEFAA